MTRDEHGDRLRYQHHELPETPAQLEANRARPYFPGGVEAAAWAVAYDLTPSCPGCSRDLGDPEDLCICDNDDTGPLCINRCCPNEHRINQPWRRVA